jgi:hypothetical protein
MQNEILGRGRSAGRSTGLDLHGEVWERQRGFAKFAGSGEDCKGKEGLTGNRWPLLLRSRNDGQSGGEESPSSAGQGGP